MAMVDSSFAELQLTQIRLSDQWADLFLYSSPDAMDYDDRLEQEVKRNLAKGQEGL